MKQNHAIPKNLLNVFQLFIFFVCLLIAFLSEAQDTTPPSSTLLEPAPDATAQSIYPSIRITFNEDIAIGTGNVVIYNYDDDTPFQTIDVANMPSYYTLNGDQISFWRDDTFEDLTKYYVEICNTCITDLAGNPFSGISGKDTWSFTTGDSQPPQFTDVSPGNTTTDVAIDVNLIITFDENVRFEPNEEIYIKYVSDDQVWATINANSSNISISDNVVTIDPPSDMPYDTELYVEIDQYGYEGDGIITDQYFNIFKGLDQSDWSFTTEANPDVQAPSISTLDPAHNATDVTVETAAITATFDEPIELIDLENTNGGTIQVMDGVTNPVYSFGADDVSISGNDLIINTNVVTGGLLDGTMHRVNVFDFFISDLAGNRYMGTSANSWNFTTEEVVNIPDANFKDYLVNNTFINTNGDDEIQVSEAAAFAGMINVYSRDIADLTGIEAFTSLTGLSVLDNDLTSIDLSQNTMLEMLNVGFNSLTALNVSNNTKLTYLGAYVNSISSLDVSQNIDLTILEIYDNDLTAIDVSQNENLETLEIQENQLTSLDVSQNPLLEALYCDNNEITTLDLSQSTGLYEIYCHDNSLTELNVANGNNSEGYIDATNNPGLTCIQVDDAEDTNLDSWQVDAGASFSEDCSVPEDTEAPTVVSFSYRQATGVPVDIGELTITFSEPVVTTSNLNINMWDYSNSLIVQHLGQTPSGVSIDEEVVTFTVPQLTYEESYYIQIAGGSFKDLAGNNYAGILGAQHWYFTAESEPDNDAPILASRNPSVNSTGFGLDDNLVMTFDEEVQLTGSGNLAIFDRSTDSQVGVGWFFPAAATVDGDEITIDIPVSLDPGTEYYVEITNAIEDLAENSFPDITGPDGWYFTTEGELDAPMIVSRTPESGTADVDISTNLSLTFDEPVELTGSGGFKIFNRANDNQIGVNWSFSTFAEADGNTVTVDVPITLPYGTEVYFEITNAIEDEWGNVVADISGNADWYFTTESEPDETSPSIVSLTPADDATAAAVDSDLVIEFDEPINKGNGTIALHFYSNNSMSQSVDVTSDNVVISGSTVTIDLPLNLMTDLRYWVSISSSAFADDAGNTFAGIAVGNKDDWDFTTDMTAPDPPVVVALSPSNVAADVGLNAELSLVFSEDIMLGVNGTTKQIVIQRVGGGGGNFAGIYLTAGMISGNKLTVPHDDFEAGITYRIILNEGVITDLDNNAFEGFLGSDWTFTVGDKQAQTITFEALADRMFGDDPFELSATSTSGLPVMFSIVDGPISLSGNTVTITGAGTVTVAANQEGNEDYTAAEEVTQTFEVLKADQTISFNPVSNMTFGDAPFNLSATTSSGLDVTFSIVSGPVSLVDDEITITGAGTAVIAANQVGDANFNPAPEEQQTFVITKASQTITIEPIADKLTTDGSFDVVANVDSELVLEYSVSGPGTNSDETITLTGEVGTVTVTVSQAGNENYLEASESITFEVKEEEIALALDDEAEIKFYPNPVIDYLMFEGDQQLDVQLMDLNGKVMRSLKARTGKLDVSDLREGMYLLEVRSAQGILKEKIVKTN